MTEIVHERTASAVAQAIEANLVERFARFGQVPGAELHRAPALTWFSTGLPCLFFNGVLCAHLSPDNLDAAIVSALAPFLDRAVPMFWMTGPSTQPATLGPALEARGLTDAGELIGMAVDLRSLPGDRPAPPGLVIEPVEDIRTLRQWIAAFTRGFAHPPSVGEAFCEAFAHLGLGVQQPLRHYLGVLAGEPVATASLFMEAGVAGVYSVSTIPAVRRQGIGTAMTLATLGAARVLGYRMGVLQAEPAGLGLYRRLGFQAYCTLRPYLWSPPITPA